MLRALGVPPMCAAPMLLGGDERDFLLGEPVEFIHEGIHLPVAPGYFVFVIGAVGFIGGSGDLRLSRKHELHELHELIVLRALLIYRG